jgi:hypothetical protein
MDKFQFELNKFKNVYHIFKDDRRKKPLDTVSLMQTGENENDQGWVPHNHKVQKTLKVITKDFQEVKDFYNKNYDDICMLLDPDYGLNIEGKKSGYAIDYQRCAIEPVVDASTDASSYFASAHYQAVGMTALCKISHILPLYNQGWKPDWDREDEKWCIHTVRNEHKVSSTRHNRMLLVFPTEQKAEYFLNKKIDLVVNLSNAGYI